MRFFTFLVIFVAAALIFCYEIRFLHVKNVNDLVDIGAYVCPTMQLMQLFTRRSPPAFVWFLELCLVVVLFCGIPVILSDVVFGEMRGLITRAFMLAVAPIIIIFTIFRHKVIN